MYEPITVEIDRNYGDGTYRSSQHIKFTGRLVKLIKKGSTAMRLYEWVDRGYVIYLVHVNEEKPRRLPRGRGLCKRVNMACPAASAEVVNRSSWDLPPKKSPGTY